MMLTLARFLRPTAIAILVAFAVISFGAVVAAQPADKMPVADDAPYNSPIRTQCEDDLLKDRAWRADLEKRIRVKVHNEEANLIAKNKKHVIMAYSAMWIIIVLFVVFTWRKHRALKAEAELLHAEVERLADEADA